MFVMHVQLTHLLVLTNQNLEEIQVKAVFKKFLFFLKKEAINKKHIDSNLYTLRN